MGQPAKPPRKAVNLRADAELVELAKSLGINLSQLFEQGLRQAVAAERKRRWEEENREAIDNYNRRVERDGTFAERYWGR
ncbi:MAG: acetoacetyl-CoA synthase [Alphaproteobacteria bacterium]|nr:acetoacetyl-CoA synthase [Alphaproteobacteria bacterium]